MNKVYKTVWNALRHCLVVVSEATKSASQRGSTSYANGSEIGVPSPKKSVGFKHSKLSLKLLPLSITLAFALPAWSTNLSGTISSNLYNTYGRTGSTYNFIGDTTITADQFFDVTAGTVFRVQSGVTVNMTAPIFRTYCRHSCNYSFNISGTFILSEDSQWTTTGGSSNRGIVSNGGLLKLDGYWAVTNQGVTIQSGGTVETKAKNFFNNVKSGINLTQISLQALNGDNEESTVESDSYAIKEFSQTVGSLRRSVSNSGTFIVTDIADGTQAANSIRSAIGGNVIFTGEAEEDGITSEFNTTLINQLIEEGYQDMVYYANELMANAKNLTISKDPGSSTVINGNTGFKSIANAEEITVKDGRKLTLIGSGADTEKIIKTGGSISVADGTLQLGNEVLNKMGGLLNTVNLSDQSNLSVQKGNFTIQSLNGGNSITNSGSLNIDNWVNAQNINYEQTGGVLTVKNGWMDNSVLNIKGGTLTKDALGRNTLNISGGLVTIDDLSEGTSISQSDGTLTTLQDSVFENVRFSEIDPLNTIKLSQSIPQDIKETMTELFQKYVPGNVAEHLAHSASFVGGKLVITGVDLTETMRDDLTTAFKETFFGCFQERCFECCEGQ